MSTRRFVEAFDEGKSQSTVIQDQEIMNQTNLSGDVQDKEAQTAVVTALDNSSVDFSQDDPADTLPPVPLQIKLLSVLLVSCIGFGSQWSGGVSSAMKSTIKKVHYYILLSHKSIGILIEWKGNAHQQYTVLSARSQ